MSKITTIITANGDYLVAKSAKPRGADSYKATVIVAGTWSGGTIAWKLSPDKGVTKINAFDATGVAYSSSADDNFNIELAGSAMNGPIELYASLSGAATPSLTITVFDQD